VGYFELNNDPSGSLKPSQCQDYIKYQHQINTLYLNVYRSGILYQTPLLGVGKIPVRVKVENTNVSFLKNSN
jgi:hypothetical protein